MSKHIEYEMSEEQYARMIEACKPVPLIMLQCGPAPSQQERVNAAWTELGKEMGFKPMTATRSFRNSERFFLAEPEE